LEFLQTEFGREKEASEPALQESSEELIKLKIDQFCMSAPKFSSVFSKKRSSENA
jgi:hypothetical protein